MKKSYFVGLVWLLTVLSIEQVGAKVKLPAFFTDHMVFQQQTKAAIWGWAVEGKTVTVSTSWNNKTYKTTTDQKGKWKVLVATPAFGGPYEITISDGESMVLKDILIGEVWLCSGQSNMEMPLAGWGKINNFEEEINAANFPKIRLLQVVHQTSKWPAEDVKVTNNGWMACDPTTVASFSATAYFFARTIFQKTGVPIGLIHSSWGGTVAEAWTSAETLKNDDDFKEEVNIIQKSPDPSAQLNMNKPTVLYNAMINPFIQYAIKGVIWYQGESNAARANQYRKLFPSLINDWRTKFNIGNFPFYFVQLANYKAPAETPVASDWAELRDAQKGALKLPNTGMAVTIDIGNEKDIHPKNKQDVGKRLALIALAKTYKQQIAFSGPVFRNMQIDHNQLILNFDAAQSGLIAKNGELKGFAIAGADQHFYWAKAIIVGHKVIVSSDAVAHPVAVRYAWANNPVANLYNGDGLPASPFKTDQWIDSTAKK